MKLTSLLKNRSKMVITSRIGSRIVGIFCGRTNARGIMDATLIKMAVSLPSKWTVNLGNRRQ